MIYRDKRDCPFCRKKIDAQAVVCPYCTKNVEPVRHVSLGKVMIVALGGLFLVSFFVKEMAHPSNSASTRTPEAEVAAVARVLREYGPSAWGRVGCSDKAKEQLDAPPTVTFEWLGIAENPDTSEPYPYATAGRVTLQDRSGAMLTKGFVCYHNGQKNFVGKVVIVK